MNTRYRYRNRIRKGYRRLERDVKEYIGKYVEIEKDEEKIYRTILDR